MTTSKELLNKCLQNDYSQSTLEKCSKELRLKMIKDVDSNVEMMLK